MAQLIPVITVCGMGADLFSLPLLVCTFLLTMGIAQPPESLDWLATWWAVIGAGMLVAAEIALDSTLDRQSQLGGRAWPALQLVLSAMITVIVVLALGEALSTPAKIQVLIVAWVATGIIKLGLIENARRAVSFVIR
jgi:Domain of unknown function (DUF4126)